MPKMMNALNVIEEFVNDVRVAFGNGKAYEIDREKLDWPDLAETYEHALTCLHNAARIVTCSICGVLCSGEKAHLHQDEWIGDECCWDERLRASE